MPRRQSKKATRTRRRVGHRASARTSASATLAKAREQIAQLQVEIRRLRKELALVRGDTAGGRSPDQDAGPLAPGM